MSKFEKDIKSFVESLKENIFPYDGVAYNAILNILDLMLYKYTDDGCSAFNNQIKTPKEVKEKIDSIIADTLDKL